MEMLPKTDIWQCQTCKTIFKIKRDNKMPDDKTTPEITEYKGNKLLTLNPKAKFTFSFGVQKAKMIIEHIDSIRAFAESEGERCVPEDLYKRG